MTQQNARWIVRPRPAVEARLRLFCLPFAGGGALAYRPWAAHLPPEVELCAIQPPGRESRLREPPFARMETLVSAVAQAVEPYLDLPFALFGHSLGSVTAFELARHLRRVGAAEPVLLAVSGHGAPHLPNPNPSLHRMPTPELIATLRRYGGTPEEVLSNAELVALFLPLLRVDFEVLETYRYRPEPPLAVPISAFGGDRDPRTSREYLEAWKAETTVGFTSRIFPGDHFFLRPQMPAVLAALVADLAPYLGNRLM